MYWAQHLGYLHCVLYLNASCVDIHSAAALLSAAHATPPVLSRRSLQHNVSHSPTSHCSVKYTTSQHSFLKSLCNDSNAGFTVRAHSLINSVVGFQYQTRGRIAGSDLHRVTAVSHTHTFLMFLVRRFYFSDSIT